MSDSGGDTIPELDAVVSLAGNELVPVVQDGETRRATTSQIVTYASGTGNFLLPANNLSDVDDGATAVENIGAAFTVPTLAALKGLTSRPEAVIVETGTAAGLWQWESGDTTPPDDVTVVECTTGESGRYKLIPFDIEGLGLTSDPKIIDADDNTTAATFIAQLKGINEAAHSTAAAATIAQGTTTGSTNQHHVVLAGSNNATSLKAAAGQVYSYDIGSVRASPFYVKFYDKATAPNPAADTVVWTVHVPATTRVVAEFPRGLQFTVGIAYAVVTGIGDTDNTAVTASDGTLNIEFV